MLDALDKNFAYFANQTSFNMAKILLLFKFLEIGCTPPILGVKLEYTLFNVYSTAKS